MITPVAIIVSLLAYVQSAPAVPSAPDPTPVGAAKNSTATPNCGSFGKTYYNHIKWTNANKLPGYATLTKTFQTTQYNVCCPGACCNKLPVATLAKLVCDPILVATRPGQALMDVPRSQGCLLGVTCMGVEDKALATAPPPPASALPGSKHRLDLIES